MAASLGPNITKDSLLVSLDAADRNSFLKYSLINMSTWTTGTGGVAGYNPNQTAATENQRFSGTNPWGETSIIWGSFPSGDGEADGGWVTYADYSIDKSKMYRFSVWARRTSSTTGGTAYLGCTSWDAAQYVKRTTDSVNEPNPYWYYNNIANFTQNVWYLIVGHLYPFDTTFTGRHSDSGLYNVGSVEKVADIGGNTGGGDFKFAPTSTYLFQRVFHYYCGDNTSRLQWYDPRIDLVDGTEPSIYELVNRSPIQLKDITGNKKNATLVNGPTFTNTNGGVITFSGTNYAIITSPISLSEYTFSFFCKWISNVAVGDRIFGSDAFGTYTVYNPSNVGFHYNPISAPGTTTTIYSNVNIGFGQWCHITVSVSTISPLAIIYINGIARNSSTNIPSGNLVGNLYLGAQSTLYGSNCNVANFNLYSNVLSPSEILENYKTAKSRFGL